MPGDLAPLSRVLERSSDPDNPDSEAVAEIIRSTDRIAVVGLSRDPAKAARRVPTYLAASGYDLVPVNPNADHLLGKAAFDHLDEVADPVDMVLVFRPSEDAGQVVKDAAKRAEAPVIWLQEGIRDDEAATEARKKGARVVQDLCIYKAHRALGQPPRRS